MSTPNIEELMRQLRQYGGDGGSVYHRHLLDAATALQSQAERIAELERESETHSKAYGFAIVERDNLRTEVEAVRKANLDCVDHYNAALDEINELGQQLKVAQEGWRCECSTDDACRFARERDAKAEHIKELEADFSRLEATAQKFCVRNTFVEAENDTLRAQLADIAATEPVAWMFDEAKYHENDMRGRQWMPKISRHIPAVPWMQRNVVPLFTRPMPAQDVTELVEALENLARLGNGEHYGNSDGNMIARGALSKYKGAK